MNPSYWKCRAYRFPTLRQMVLRGWHEVRHFLNRASKFIVIGVGACLGVDNFPPASPPAAAPPGQAKSAPGWRPSSTRSHQQTNWPLR